MRNEKLLQRYKTIAGIWNDPGFAGRRRDDLLSRMLDMADLKEGQIVLDLMCGTGRLASALRERYGHGLTVHVADFCQEMLDQVPSEAYDQAFCVNVLDAAGVLPGHYDAVFMRTCLHDLPREEQPRVLSVVRQLLAPTGQLNLQAYLPDARTQSLQNELINLKDQYAGWRDQNQFPRYFATTEELETWLKQVGFSMMDRHDFIGQAVPGHELSLDNLRTFNSYLSTIDNAQASAIGLSLDDKGCYTYALPGQILRLRLI
jgi:ubiquinone/menaquinone biosynthesis C-methylase UbiE